MGFIRLIIAFSFLCGTPFKACHFPSIASHFLSSSPVEVKKIPRFLESESPATLKKWKIRRYQCVEKVSLQAVQKLVPYRIRDARMQGSR
jgi:hypothetical protein